MEEIVNALPYGPIDIAEMKFSNIDVHNETQKRKLHIWSWISIAILSVSGTILIRSYIDNKQSKTYDL